MTDSTPVTIQLRNAGDDGELAGLAHMIGLLEHFEPRTRERMLNYLCDRFPSVRIADGEIAQQEGK